VGPQDGTHSASVAGLPSFPGASKHGQPFRAVPRGKGGFHELFQPIKHGEDDRPGCSCSWRFSPTAISGRLRQTNRASDNSFQGIAQHPRQHASSAGTADVMARKSVVAGTPRHRRR
jgi:hypothetical protein